MIAYQIIGYMHFHQRLSYKQGGYGAPTYVFGVNVGDPNDVTPVGNLGWLVLHHVVGELEESLELVAGEDEYLI